jgi:hypothetical protein
LVPFGERTVRRQLREEAPLLSTVKRVSPEASSRISTVLKRASWQYIVMFATSLRVKPGRRVKGLGENVSERSMIGERKSSRDENEWN